MTKHYTLSTVFFTIFLDFFILGLIYPLFTGLFYESSQGMIPEHSSEFYKNGMFGLLISSFPMGQFLGAPIIGQLSDRFGRRKLLILSSIGTVATLLLCAFGVFFSSLTTLFLGRFLGGTMAGNMMLAYAALTDFSSSKDKVKNFALIPLASGMGFAAGPYVSELLALAGLSFPFFFAVVLALINLLLVVTKFPEMLVSKVSQEPLKISFIAFYHLRDGLRNTIMRFSFLNLFLMVSANLLFIQFIGPFARDHLNLSLQQVSYLYVNIGVSLAFGHLLLTRRLVDYLSLDVSLISSLFLLGVFLVSLPFANDLAMLHVFTSLIMFACAVAYTNAVALISDQANKHNQGEAMGIASSIQSCAEFLPAAIIGFVASISLVIPMAAAALCAFSAFLLCFGIFFRNKRRSSAIIMH